MNWDELVSEYLDLGVELTAWGRRLFDGHSDYADYVKYGDAFLVAEHRVPVEYTPPERQLSVGRSRRASR